MKKLVMAVVAFSVLLGWGITNASAQQVAWDDPYDLLTTSLTKMSADSSLYGINGTGQIVAVSLASTVAGTPGTGVDVSQATDLAVSQKGTVFAINDTTVVTWTAAAGIAVLSPQPKIPDVAGTFKQIAFGEGGKLFVLYQATADGHQYILQGHEVNQTMEAAFDPRTLNLAAKGNWVSCKISLPEGHSERDIDADTVQITRIQAPVPGGAPVDAAVAIFRAPGSPASADSNRLHVKFLRYDKNVPNNPQSLNAALLGLLPASGQHKAIYQVTVTVRAQLTTTEEWFEGTGSFQAMVPKEPR
ncbi:MAG TPA: hypothetical protein VGJ94_14180 [Syntrophorhabdaceae bacterium]|jgi:hypothetical protein